MASAASVTLQSHAQGSSREDGVSAWGIYTGCSQREFLKTFYFEIIVDSRAIVRNQRAIPTPFVTSCKTIKICHNQMGSASCEMTLSVTGRDAGQTPGWQAWVVEVE